MNILISRILKYLNGTLVYDQYYKFCLYLVYHYLEFEKLSFEDVIKESSISKEEILKFCRLLGFDSFESFKTVLIQDHMMRLDQIRARMLGINTKQLIDRLDKDESEDEVIDNISTICEAIFKAKRIILIGGLYPLSITVELQTDLITLGKPVVQYHSFDKELQLNEEDLIIFISATGRSMYDFIRIKQELHVEKASSILITQNKHYSLSNQNISNYVIHVPGKFDGIIFNYQIMTICDLLRIQYYQQYYLS